MLKGSSLTSSLPVFVICCVVSVLLCAPAFDRLFASDDYCILDHFDKGGNIMIEGFFRPIAGLTMKSSFMLSGWSSFNFYLVIALLHGVNAWLVYELCCRLARVAAFSPGFWFPMLSALFFLTYHSVGEVIFWALCQGISVAVSLSLIACIVFFSNMHKAARYIIVPLLYLVAISTYESVLFVPAILLAAIYFLRLRENFLVWTGLFAAAFLINIVLRVLYTGKLWATYTGVVFSKTAGDYAVSFSKSLSRIFVPYMDAPTTFVVVTLVVAVVLVWALIKTGKNDNQRKRVITWMVTALLFAALPALFYGASTRTSEGDRFLYFPAVFVSMLAAYLVYHIRIRKWRILVASAIGVAGILLILRTRNNWIEADRQVKTLIQQLSTNTARPIYISGLPDEYKGAFQFRNCFNLMLQHNNVPQPHAIFKVAAMGVQPAASGSTASWNGTGLEFAK